jgi:UDP-N-acetylmuramate dehydrogenase
MSIALGNNCLPCCRSESEIDVTFGDRIRGAIQGTVLEGEPLSRHTSFGIGGAADYFIRPKTEEELVKVLELIQAEGLSLMIIGRGTNLLVGDAGLRGVVVDLRMACRRLERAAGRITSGAGVAVSELLEFCLIQELGGLEFMAGIPGSVGGAIRVNAGAWDRAVGDLVEAVRGYLPSGREVTLERSALEFGYRYTSLPAEMIIVETELILKPEKSDVIREKMADYRRRRRHQPADQKSAGSVFKNPPATSAGRLIEMAGCKGLKVDGAQVSSQHANFIVNLGGASAAAVRELIERVRRKVRDHSGVELELEIICVGEE